jgi:glutamate-1-semialdehyde 2,1-aminomutase
MIVAAYPSIDRVRLTSSGTEATMSAIRLARAFTKRDTIMKFTGCYHGHADSLLVRAGSGAFTLSLPDSAGVPAPFARETISLPYNDLDTFEKVMNQKSGSIACVIVEPVAGNMGLIPPARGFLTGLRAVTQKHGTVLIFDEVITGFRLAYGGAQEYFGIQADLTVLGKILGGGLPIGAFGGRGDIMQCLAPDGPVYQAGTLSGNPIATAAGIATLTLLSKKDIYTDLDQKGQLLEEGITEAVQAALFPTVFSRIGSMFTLFFHPGPVRDWEDAQAADRTRYARFFHALLDQGVYFPPSQFETAFLSTAHSARDIAKTVRAIRNSIDKLGS